MDGQAIESRIYEFGIDSSAVTAGIERMQAQLAELDLAFERTGERASAALTSVESKLGATSAGFAGLTRQVNAYANALDAANAKSREFRAPDMGSGSNSKRDSGYGYEDDLFDLQQERAQMAAELEQLRNKAPIRDAKGRFAKKNDWDGTYDDYASHQSTPFRQQNNDTFYHGTTEDRLESIFSQGLIPTDRDKYLPPASFVSEGRETANVYGLTRSATENSRPAILQIDMPPDVAEKLLRFDTRAIGSADPNDYYATKGIPPQYIRGAEIGNSISMNQYEFSKEFEAKTKGLYQEYQKNPYFSDYENSSSAPFRQQQNSTDELRRSIESLENQRNLKQAAEVPTDLYQPALGGTLSPIRPTRTPDIGLGQPLTPALGEEPPFAQQRTGGFSDPFGTYGQGGSLREKYGEQLEALKLRRAALEELRAQQNLVTPEMKQARFDALDAFMGANQDGNGLYTTSAQSKFGGMGTDDFVSRLRQGSAGIQQDATAGLEAEKLHDYANALRAAGQGADVYSDGTVKVRNASGQTQTVLGNLKKGVDELKDSASGGSGGGGGGVLGALEYSMLRSFAVMGVFWGGLNLISDATQKWVTNTVEADYTLNMLGYTTEKTRGELADLTRESMAVSASYGIGAAQSLPATVLASRSSQEPKDILSLVKNSAQMSMITGQGQEQAMESLIAIQRKWNLEAAETGRINDVIAVAYKNTIAPLDQFSEALVRMSAFGRENNLTLEQTAGLIAGFMNATGISEPSRAETFFEVIGGIQKQPQNIELLRQQGIGVYGQDGELLKTTDLINNISAAWAGMSAEEQKSTVLALVGRQRLNEGLDYFNTYATKATETMAKFNDTVGAGPKIDEARGQSLKQMWAEFTAGIDAAMSDPEVIQILFGKKQTDMVMRSEFGIPDNIEVPNSIRDIFNKPLSERGDGDAQIRNWLKVATSPESFRGLDQQDRISFNRSNNILAAGNGATPQMNLDAQNLIENYGSFKKSSMTGAEFDVRAIQAEKEAYDQIDQAARQVATSEGEISSIKARINEKMEQTVVLYQTADGHVRTLKANVAALMDEQERSVKLPSFQTSTLSSSELDAQISKARGLAAQYKVTVEGAGYSTKGLEEEWAKTSIAIRTSDGSLRVLTGQAAVFLSQAMQIGRAVQTWKAPNMQISDQTPQQWAQQEKVANSLAAQYISQIESSNMPLDAKKQILEQIKQQWSQEIVFIRLANGSIVQATGATAAFAGQAGQVTAQWERAALAITKATQIRPNIQTMPELNGQLAGQLQQYLVQYENLLRQMNVAQTPQQYMIMGQNGSMYQFVTSADAMQLAMALLQEQIGYNTAATSDSTDATKDAAKKSDQLRGSYNLPTEWDYKPPTAWEYYDDAKKNNRQVGMGPVNYPWMFPNENGGSSSGLTALQKFMAQPHLGMVPGGAGSLLETTFGKELPKDIDPATQMMLDASKMQDNAANIMLNAVNIFAGNDKTGTNSTNVLSGNKTGTHLPLPWGYTKDQLFPFGDLFGEQAQQGGGGGGARMFKMPLGDSRQSSDIDRAEMLRMLAEASIAMQSSFQDPLRGLGKEGQQFGANPKNYSRFGLAGHDGLDFTAPLGTPIYPIAPGEITSVGKGKDYGFQVWEKLADGATVLYAHLMQMPNVQAGQKVDLNTLLGNVGSTGNSTGPHLHLGYKPGDPSKAAPGMNGWANPNDMLGDDSQSTNVRGIPQLQASSAAIATNTSNLLSRVPTGLTGISTNIAGSNILLAQMNAYLSRIAVSVAKPPIFNVNVEQTGDVTVAPKGSFGSGAQAGIGALGTGGSIGGGVI